LPVTVALSCNDVPSANGEVITPSLPLWKAVDTVTVPWLIVKSSQTGVVMLFHFVVSLLA
jgi:hypothetical protein